MLLLGELFHFRFISNLVLFGEEIDSISLKREVKMVNFLSYFKFHLNVLTQDAFRTLPWYQKVTKFKEKGSVCLSVHIHICFCVCVCHTDYFNFKILVSRKKSRIKPSSVTNPTSYIVYKTRLTI